MTAQCALYVGALKIFELPDYAYGYYSQNFSWALVPIDPMNVPTKFEVRSCTRSRDNRGYPTNGGTGGARGEAFAPGGTFQGAAF